MPPSLDLTSLLGPTSVADFLRYHWEKAPLLVRQASERLGDLLSVDCLEGVVVSAREGAVSAVRSVDGQTVEHPLTTSAGGAPALASLYHAYDQGFSIIINHLGAQHPAAAALCRSLEAELGHPVGCNAFLTPPGGTCFVPHYDAMDTFFVQVAGPKSWAVHEPLVELPFGEGFDKPDPASLGKPYLTAELCPGDVLFLPRGWIHAGSTQPSQLSLHLTFGVKTTRWLDVILDAARTAASCDRRLREAVPLAPLLDQEVDPEATLTELLDALPAAADPATLTRLLGERASRRHASMEPHLDQVMQADRIHLDTVVERRPGLPPVVVEDGDGVTLHFAGSRASGPPQAGPAFRFVAATPSFAPRNLPEPLDDGGRIALVRLLIREGLVAVPAVAHGGV